MKTHVLSWEKQLMGCRRVRTCSKEQKVESAAGTGGTIYTQTNTGPVLEKHFTKT